MWLYCEPFLWTLLWILIAAYLFLFLPLQALNMKLKLIEGAMNSFSKLLVHENLGTMVLWAAIFFWKISRTLPQPYKLNERFLWELLLFVNGNPANIPSVFHVETTRKQPFPRRFNVEYRRCVCGEHLFAQSPSNFRDSF